MKKIQSLFLPVAVASILASGIACADNVFVVNNGGNTVTLISNNVVDPVPFIDTNLNSPTGIAIFDNNYYVSNNGVDGAGYIAEFNSSGHFITDYSTSEDGPRGLAFDSAGNLYVVNQTSGNVVEIPTGGPPAPESVLVKVAPGANDVVIHDGTFYLTDGVVSTISGGVATPFASAGLSSPNGIAFDDVGINAGNFFVVNHGTSSVLEFNDITGAPVGTHPFITDLNPSDQPKTIAIDSAGNFYVTDNGDNTVTEYDPTGTMVLNTFNASGDFDGPCFVLTEPALTVPEPSTYALLIAGLGLLFFMGRRKTATV